MDALHWYPLNFIYTHLYNRLLRQTTMINASFGNSATFSIQKLHKTQCRRVSAQITFELKYHLAYLCYRSGMVNSNAVNSKFHLIRSYYEIFFYHFPNISCLKCTVNSKFHLIRSKTLLTNDVELTVPNLYLLLRFQWTNCVIFFHCQ